MFGKKRNQRAARRAGIETAVLALGLLLLLALMPAAGAAKGGTQGPASKCMDVSEQGDGYVIVWIVCDNPAEGSTDCTFYGDYFYAASWNTGKKPDSNRDGIICERIIFRG